MNISGFCTNTSAHSVCDDAGVTIFAPSGIGSVHSPAPVMFLFLYHRVNPPVILCDDLLGHVLTGVRFLDARESEVAYLEDAIAVHQQVSGFDVAVQDAGRVQVF